MSEETQEEELFDEADIDVAVLDGVGPATKQKLNNAGIYNLMDLLVHSANYILDVLGGSMDKVLKLQEKARSELSEHKLLYTDFVSAEELYEKRQKIAFIPTGSKNLDDLLMGGVETQAITEFYGEFGSGKTQICHALSVNVQLDRDQGGLNSSAIYLDTEKTFRPSRIIEMGEGKHDDPMQLLKNIHVARAMNSSHLRLLVRNLGEKIRDTRAKLIVIDSAVAPFRAEYVGRGQLAERQQVLNVMMHDLTRLAELYEVAIVITNQVMAKPDVFFGDPTRPIGGHVVSHATTYRLYLRKARNARVASIMDSPHHPPGEAVFVIAKEGIIDKE